MGHLNLVGFETGSHLDEVYSASGDVLTQSLTTRTGGFALKVSPVDSATANVSVSTISSAGEHVETLADTSYVRFYLRIETLPTATEEIFVIDGESIAKLSLRLTSTGHVSLYRGELIHVVTGSTALPVNQWVQMELFVETGVAAGYELRINEFSEFSGTMDSQESATLYYFGKLNDWNGSGYVVYFDDIAIRDDMWAGSGEIKVLTPNGTGTYDDWTPSTGLVSYPCVDEIPFNDDTDYISTVFVDDATTVSLQNTSTANVTGTVNGVKVVARVRDSGASPFGAGVLVRLKSGGTTVDTSSSTVYNSYVSRFYLSTLDPNTSANWTLSSLDSLEVGVVHRPPASLTGVRCTTVVAMVDYNPTTAFTASPLGSLKSSGAAVLTHTVQYDSNQRITISGSGNGQRTFFYDSVGNLSFKGLLWYENYHVPRIQLTVSGVFPVLVTANTWVHSPSGQLFNVGGSATLLSRQGLVYIGNGGKQQGLFLANDSVVQGFGYQTSNDNTSDFIAGQSSLPTPGQWYSVVLKRVNDTVYLFVNGTLITQSSNPSAVAEYGICWLHTEGFCKFFR